MEDSRDVMGRSGSPRLKASPRWFPLALGVALFASGCAPEPEIGVQSSPILSRSGYSGATWVGSANHYRVGRECPVRMIVVHVAEGTAESAGSWFNQELQQKADGTIVDVSAHYIVGENGRVDQFVDENNVAFHAREDNCHSIGIEHEGWRDGRACQDASKCPPGSKNWYTKAMYSASASLIADIIRRRPELSSISLDQLIKGHGEVNSGTPCPGTFLAGANRQRYFDLIRDALRGGATAEPGSGSSSSTDTGTGTGVGRDGNTSPREREQADRIAMQLFGQQGADPGAGSSPYILGPVVGERLLGYEGEGETEGSDCSGAGAACLLPGQEASSNCSWGTWRCEAGVGRCRATSRCSDDGRRSDETVSCRPEIEGRPCRMPGAQGACAVGELTCRTGELSCAPTYDAETCEQIEAARGASGVIAGAIEQCNGKDDNGDLFVDEGTDGGVCETADGPGRELCIAGRLQCSAADVPGLSDVARHGGGGGPWGCRMALTSHASAPWLLFAAFVCLSFSRRRRR